MATLPPEVLEFRTDYRTAHISRYYSGVLHFCFTSFGCLGLIALALRGVESPTAFELLTVPITFLYANLVEYLGHKGPMHRATRWLFLVFERHTLQHHHFFTSRAMSYETTRDYKMVLFPPVMLVFFFGGLALPSGALLFVLASHNVARLFVATAMGYFLTYEWLHFCHHLPESSWVGRLPFLGRLRAHHQVHHDLARMTTCNFNITFPICDALFGTRHKA